MNCASENYLSVLVTNISYDFLTHGTMIQNMGSNTLGGTFQPMALNFSMTPPRIRTNSLNTMSSGIYIAYTSSSAITYSSNFTVSSSFINNSPDEIIDIRFVTASQTEVFALFKTSTEYQISFYVGKTQMKKESLPLTFANSSFVKSVADQSVVYFLFNSGILAMKENSSLTFLANIQFNSSTTLRKSLDVYSGMMVFAEGDKMTIVNTNNMASLKILARLSVGIQIDDAMIRFPFIIFLTNSTLYQYDIEVGTVISGRKVITTVDQCRLQILTNKYIYVFREYPGLHANFPGYLYNETYLHTNGTCSTGYFVDAERCKRNFSFVPSNPEPETPLESFPTPPDNTNETNGTNNTNSSNETNEPNNTNSSNGNETNSTNETNNDNETNSTNGTVPNNPGENNNETNNPDEDSDIDLDWSEIISTNVGKILSFSSFSLLPSPFQCLALFFDDMWYYKYHRTNYPEDAQVFMENIDIINELRLSPWFIKNIEFFDKLTVPFDSTLYNEQISSHEHNPESFYFLENAEEVYIENWLMNLFFFLLIKILQFILKFTRTQSKFASKIKSWVKSNSKWWTLLTSGVETNLMRLSFNCFLQFLIASSFQPLNKVNMLICMAFLFIIIIYTFTFYPLIYFYEGKKSAETLLVYSNYSLQSYQFESFCILLRTMVRGSIQALLIQDYSSQITSLAASNLFFVLISVYFRKEFLNKFTFICLFLYNCSFLSMDLILVLLHRKSEFFDQIDENKLVFGLMILTFIMFIFTFVSITVSGIIEFCTKKPKKRQSASTFKTRTHTTIGGFIVKFQHEGSTSKMRAPSTPKECNHDNLIPVQQVKKCQKGGEKKTSKTLKIEPEKQFSKSQKGIPKSEKRIQNELKIDQTKREMGN